MSEETRPINVDLADDNRTSCYEYLIIDRSGSMRPLQDTVIQQVNDYIAKSKESRKTLNLPTYLSILLFDDMQIQHLNFAPIEEAIPLTHDTYVPRGMTALNDAVADAISHLRDELKGREKEVSVVLTVFTDGYENCSVRYPGTNNAELKGFITEISNSFNWVVNYIGAGKAEVVHDAAASLGIPCSNTMHYSASTAGVTDAMTMFSISNESRKVRLAKSGLQSCTNVGYFSSSDSNPPVDTTASVSNQV